MKKEEKELMEAVLEQLERLNKSLVLFTQQLSILADMKAMELELEEEEFAHSLGPTGPIMYN